MAEGFKAGSIIAELRMEKGTWNSSVKDVQADTEKLKKSAGSWGDKVAGVGKAFTVAGGVVVGSLIGMLKATADVGDNINDLSQRVGISTETLSSYRLAADQSGSSLEGVAKGLKGLAANMVDAKNGTGEGSKAFKELGLTATDSHGKLKPLDSMMEEVADKFAGMEAGAAKSDMAVRLFGKAGLELIPVLNMGGEGLRKNREEAERLGMVFSKQAAAACDDFNDRVTALKYGLGGTAKELAMAVMPAVTDFMKGVTNTVVKIREWAQAHPELTKQIVNIALKVGALMMVLGPLLIIIPKIIKLKNDWAGSISKLNAAHPSLLGNLGKIAAVGGAAFAGWQLGRLIGELTGLDGVLQGVFDKTFRFVGIIKDSNAEVGTSAGHIAAAARQQEIFARAFEISGQKVERLPAAIAILTEEYKKHGTTGSVALDAIAKGHLAAEDAEAKHRKTTELIGPATEAALEAQKKWTEFLQTAGIVTIKEKTDRLGVLAVYMKNAEDLYKSGKISAADYAKAIQTASDEAAAMGKAWTTALPPARNLMDAVRQMPKTVDSAVYAYKSFEDQVKDAAEAFDVSQAEILRGLYNVRREFLALAGITLPPFPTIDFGPVEAGAKTATTDTRDYFTGLYNDIATGWGDTVQKWFEGSLTLKDFAKSLWGDVKSSFFRMVGEMVSGEVLGTFQSLFSKIGKSGTDAATTAVGGIGKTVSGLATGIGSVIGSLVGAVATGIVTLGTAIASVIVTLATAISSAATILAAAAGPIAIVLGIAIAAFAAFKLVEGLFGGGGGKQTDVTYWLKMIKDNSQILVNLASGNFLDLAMRSTAKLESINDDKFSTLLDWDWQRNSYLESIAKNTAGTYEMSSVTANILKGAKFAASGYEGIARGATTFVAGEHVPEMVSIRPLTEARAIPLAAGGAGGGREISVVNHISVTLDPMSDRQIMRQRFIPEFLAAMEANFMKSLIRQQLGA